ncbi:hypothetical protein [Geothrix sp.]|jgi:hypothetical protein|uniref:hypothetical protein n=1 Tax=Geothrix sp. TaxID=1962974 RepID=UPI0025C4A36C|nr:hypothetical protein [Geothrix sp.]
MRPSILALLIAAPLTTQAAQTTTPTAAQTPAPAAAPKADIFSPVRFLVGQWKGEGDGQPGQATGAATFRFELEGKALVRRSHADYPPANGRPATHHEDLMTIFAEGGQLKAIYFDNEGHVIRYTGAAVPGGVAFTSEPAPGPRFRLTYLQKPDAAVTVCFEIAPPLAPDAFKTYLEGATRQVK